MNVTRRDFLKGVGIAGLALVLPPLGFSPLEDPKKFNPNHEYGRGMEYGKSYRRYEVIPWLHAHARRVLPSDTLYVIVELKREFLPHDCDKAVAWYSGPPLKDAWEYWGGHPEEAKDSYYWERWQLRPEFEKIVGFYVA